MSALRRRREAALTNTLSITLDGPAVSDGSVPLATLLVALDGTQDAVRLMVEHLGDRERRPGPAPQWVREQCALRFAGARSGSVVLDLALEPTATGSQGYFPHLGERAIEAIQAWDGSEDSTLPGAVTARLYEAAAAIPEDIHLWIGDTKAGQRVEVMRPGGVARREPESADALLYGWLREVNWDRRTAQLHDYSGHYVRIRFDPVLDDEMLRLATRYVEVKGTGRFDKDDEWTSVHVEQLSETRSWSEPFDLEAFLDDPSPKIFDPDKVVTIDLTDEEWESFDRAIREGREA